MIEQTIDRRDSLEAYKEKTSGGGSIEFLQDQLETFIDERFEESGLSDTDVEKYFKNSR